MATSATLTAFLRYLLPLYLVSCFSLFLVTVCWQQYESHQVLRAQLQQFAATAALSLQPSLGAMTPEQLTLRLAELQYSAVFPVATLALYQDDGQLLAVVGAQDYIPATNQLSFAVGGELEKINGHWVSLQTIKSQSLPFEQFNSSTNSATHLLIIPERQPWQWHKYWPLLLALLWLSLLLVLTAILMLRQQNRHKLQLKVVEKILTSPAIDTEYLNELSDGLKQAFKWQTTQLCELQQQLLVATQKQQQADCSATHWQNLHAEQLQLQQKQRQDFNRWLEQADLLWQRREQLPSTLFNILLKLQLKHSHYQFGAVEAQIKSIELAQWLRQMLPSLNSLLPDGTSLDWLEASDNLTAKLMLDPEQLLLVLQAMLVLGLRSEAGRRLQFRIVLTCSETPYLRLQLICDGNGLPRHLASQLSPGKLIDLHWRDADMALLQLLQQCLNADFKVESLDGLGVSLHFSWQVSTEAIPTTNLPGNVLLFDADPERLSERVEALGGYTLQLISCNNLSELTQRLAEKSYQLVILMLPGQTPDEDWQVFLRQLSIPFVAFASPLSLSLWQQLLPCRPTAEFCLAAIPELFSNTTESGRKKLLVVDDNETNQAFIKILLQQRPVDLYVAHTAAQALELCQLKKFDLILLDIRLPDSSGIDVAKRLREQQAYLNIPIFAFTAHAVAAEIAEFKAAGMDDVVLKPLDPCKFDALLTEYRLY